MAFSRKIRSRPRRGLKRKRTTKKRTFSRKTSTFKRRRLSHRRSRFPTAHPHVRYVQPAQMHPDREITKMKTVYRGIYTPGSLSGIPSEVGCTDALYFAMNNVYTPGVEGPLTAIPTATGFTSLSLLYTNWQVRGARCTVRIYQSNMTGGSGVPQGTDTEWLIVPMSTSAFNVFVGTPGPSVIAFDRLKKMPGISKLAHISQQYGDGAGRQTSCKTITCFSSPARIESTPLYYSKSSSWGVGTTVPTDTPVFVLAGSHVSPLVSPASAYEMEVTITYSVMWWGRVITPLVGEPSHPLVVPSADHDMEEDEFDRFVEHTDRLSVAPPPERIERKTLFSPPRTPDVPGAKRRT